MSSIQGPSGPSGTPELPSAVGAGAGVPHTSALGSPSSVMGKASLKPPQSANAKEPAVLQKLGKAAGMLAKLGALVDKIVQKIGPKDKDAEREKRFSQSLDDLLASDPVFSKEPPQSP